MLGDGTIGGEEPLGVSGGLKPLHPSLTLAGRLVGVLGAVIEISMLPMVHPRQEFPFGRPVAFQLASDEHPWHIGQPLQQLAKELLGGCLVSPGLHENIEDVPVLIHRPPEIVTFTADREKDLIQVPLVSWPGTSVTELIRILLPELAAPLPDRFVAYRDAACE